MRRCLLLAVLLLILCGHGLDLPMLPVRLGDPPMPVVAPPEPDEDDGDDPRDTPPPVFFGEEIDAETDSLIYVIDISGSMKTGGVFGTLAGSRIARARAELVASINGLAPSYTFNVFAYSDTIYEFSPERLSATAENKGAIARWIMEFNPRGMTATGPACAKALWDKPNMAVVLLTDGLPNYGAMSRRIKKMAENGNTPPEEQQQAHMDAHREVISRANTQGATVDVFGIDSFGAMRVFCQTVAADSGGRYYDVTR